ncbi:ATP-binding cassette domain-containing protein [Pseudoduganella sp. FT55W]|uniref:ATP-binding cassette domain-containing protein n=2 Tax=Duganella rivi TaxID=2666083 RepID=A0A7X4GNI3_9BURK|nr:ATP-binding cassette domain-containing protein [Duganella rivi]
MNAKIPLAFGAKQVPMILQTEAAECGLACLAMIAGWYGHHTDLSVLRARFVISLNGVNLTHLVQYANGLKLSARALRLEIEELGQLALPCILHWDLNHFVVLVNTDRKGILIHDPAVGAHHVPYAQVAKYFTGVALELTPMASFKPADERRRVSLMALMGRVDGLWRSFGLVFGMALALEVFALAAPMLNQWVVDEALVSADRSLLNVLVGGCALMLAIQTAISLARGWTVMYLSTHLSLQWMANVFTHLLHLPMAWFEKRHLGDVVSRFGSVSTIQHTLTTGFIEAILDGLFALATLAMMLIYSVQLAAVVLIAVLVYAGIRVLSFGPLRMANEEALLLGAKEHSHFLETIRGVQAIKLFGRELDRRGRWVNLLVDSVNRSVRTEKFMLWFGIASTAVFSAEHLTVLWLGAGKVMDGALTIGMLLAFTSYGAQFGGRMAALINRFVEFRLLSVHAERLADIVLEAVEPEGQQAHVTTELAPRIELVDVSFRYAENEPWIIRHLTLTIEPGESVVLVGPSGGGKTTLVKLILGILKPTEGELRLGGCPMQLLGASASRRLMAAVMQDDHLLAGSFAENISFFDPQPLQERIELCASMAAVHDDIVGMPMGYHTLAGDMGMTLSGGQKQRILLARALYKSPKIMILDEATSHLDVLRERQVNQAIGELAMTRICVAHRPETIAMSGRVIRLGNDMPGLTQ